MIEYKTGDILKATEDVIAHQVNCRGTMGSATDTRRTTNVAHQLRMKYGDDLYFHYKRLCESEGSALLGNIQLLKMTDGKYVCNLFGQNNYGYDGRQYTSLDDLKTCLKTLENECKKLNLSSIATVYKLASNRGGAKWEDVENILHLVFDSSEIKLVIYKL